MRIVTANIKDNPDMPDPKMRADIAAVSHLGEVVFFQEIGDAADRAAITHTFTTEHWDVRNNHVEVPICVAKHYFDTLSAGVEMTHHGRAGITPNRYYSWVVARPLHRPRLHPVVFMNTHFISGAYTSKDKADQEWRQEMWQLHFRKMRTKITQFIELDYTVIFGGDTNRIHMPKFAASQRWLVNSGIDKIAVIEATRGTRIELLEQQLHPVGLNSDHDAKIAAIRLKRPR